MNERQRSTFTALAGTTTAKRMSLANSAGVGLGRDYAFDLVRPGLALYGGVPREDMTDRVRQVVFPEAQVLQRRTVRAGETVGYNATWTATVDTEVAIVNIGYADGYFRGFSNTGTAIDGKLNVIGRVSMDLVVIDIKRERIEEGDWLVLDFVLPLASIRCAASQYELLTNLGNRYDRDWHDVQ